MGRAGAVPIAKTTAGKVAQIGVPLAISAAPVVAGAAGVKKGIDYFAGGGAAGEVERRQAERKRKREQGAP